MLERRAEESGVVQAHREATAGLPRARDRIPSASWPASTVAPDREGGGEGEEVARVAQRHPDGLVADRRPRPAPARACAGVQPRGRTGAVGSLRPREAPRPDRPLRPRSTARRAAPASGRPVELLDERADAPLRRHVGPEVEREQEADLVEEPDVGRVGRHHRELAAVEGERGDAVPLGDLGGEDAPCPWDRAPRRPSRAAPAGR